MILQRGCTGKPGSNAKPEAAGPGACGHTPSSQHPLEGNKVTESVGCCNDAFTAAACLQLTAASVQKPHQSQHACCYSLMQEEAALAAERPAPAPRMRIVPALAASQQWALVDVQIPFEDANALLGAQLDRHLSFALD